MQTTRLSSRIWLGLALGLAATASSLSLAHAKDIVWARYGDIDTLDPHRATSTLSLQVWGLVYDTLLATDATGAPVPNLAKSWEVSSDGLQYTFKLASGVKCHDGTELDANDVKYTVDRAFHAANPSVPKAAWGPIPPPEAAYPRVAGLGMNAAELAANPRLTEWVVHDLTQDPRLPYDPAAFDAAGLCVSIDYLTQPLAVLREAGRVLRPSAPLVITFSNRCFPTKAIALWHHLDDEGHVALVAQWLRDSGAFADVTALDRSPRGRGDPLFAVIGRALAPG